MDSELMTKVKELRARTGLPMADVAHALGMNGSDVEKAIMWLREQGKMRAQDLIERKVGAGIIGSYVHTNARIGVLVTVHCETDFVAQTEEVKQFARDVAMHIAAVKPRYVSLAEAEKDEAFIRTETDIITKQMDADPKMMKKPADIRIKVREGKLDKVLREVTLLEQPFVKDTTKTIGSLRSELVHKLGENVQIASFVRMEV